MSAPGMLRRGASALVGFVAVAVTPSLALAAPAATDDIRDIRGPLAIPPWWHWPLAIAVAALAALAVLLVVRWWRTRAARALSPLERALRALAAADAHARSGRSHEWADVVAETLRRALAARLGTAVLPQTTAELSKSSWAQPPLADELSAPRILELLETCDLARFAKASLDTAALVASTATACEVVGRLFAPPARRTPKTAAQPQTVTP